MIDSTLIKLAKKLTVIGREHIKTKNFALPQEKKYPIFDISHARNALARVAQHGSSSEQATVRAKVHAKYPSLEKKADDGYFDDNPANDVGGTESGEPNVPAVAKRMTMPRAFNGPEQFKAPLPSIPTGLDKESMLRKLAAKV